jgi:hypothetical protein
MLYLSELIVGDPKGLDAPSPGFVQESPSNGSRVRDYRIVIRGAIKHYA